MSFRERVKDAALDVGLGRTYGHTGDHTQNCVRFWFAILLAVFGPAFRKLSDAIHLNGYALGSFANIDALVANGYAEEVDRPLDDGGVYVAQGWRKDSRGRLKGHMFGVIAPQAGPWANQDYWILEANIQPDWYRPIDVETQAQKYDVGIRWARLLDPYNP